MFVRLRASRPVESGEGHFDRNSSLVIRGSSFRTLFHTRQVISLACILCMGSCTIGWAENNTTNIISGVATNAGDSYIVGETGPFNDLEIRSGGGLTNGMGIIGYTISAANNNALVAGTGSRWINISNLYVGFTGPANHLTITNGGLVKSDFGYVANDNNSTNNTVLVTGAGSRWETTDFALGYDGPGNRLTITNGGQVLCHSDGFVGGFGDSGSDNIALVTGSGSFWSNDGDLYVGYFSDANQLILTNGGRMTNQFGYIGAFGSSNNKVLVNGTNSVWSIIGGYLSVGGQDSDNNQLMVTNGGLVNCLGAYLGNNDASETNQIVVTGAGSRWNNNGDVYAGYYGSFNQLAIQSGGQVTNMNGYLGYNRSATNNSVRVSGAGTRWQNKADLYVGMDGNGNQLTISSSGQVNSVNGFVGGSLSLGSSGNTVLVTDSGSQWSNSVALEIGFSGQDNELIITNGGKVICSFGRVGTYGDYNLAVVTGTNSQWLDSGDLYLGQEGSVNALRIENGGLVTNLTGYVGFYGGACIALVTGAGSQWQSWKLIVGYGETDNQLSIENGALVRATNVVVGFLDGSTDNLLSVSAASLIVTNAANTAQIDVRRGILALTNGTVKTAGILVSTNGVLTGTGMITASGVTNSGALAPGNSPGSLTLNASLVLQTNSLLAFELGGYSSGVAYDFLSVSNAAKLGGALSVTFINGFGGTITNGASFTLMTAASLSGAFTNVASGSRLSTADGFADFVVTYSGNNLSLSQGRLDTDGDGIPNWWMMGYFGHPAGLASDNSRAQDDADGDGMSNLAEYLAGTNPRDRSSNLRIIAVRPQTNDVRVDWTIVGGTKYLLQVAPGGSGSSFTNNFFDLSPVVIAPGTGESVTNYVEAGALTNGPARYYRVRLVP
jgi:T5SS/PEP-CTERM-associated repeat protein